MRESRRQIAPAVRLDSNVFIYLIEGAPAVSSAVQPLFEVLRHKPGIGITSEISLAEVLAGRDPTVRRLYLDLMVFADTSAWSRSAAMFCMKPPTSARSHR